MGTASPCLAVTRAPLRPGVAHSPRLPHRSPLRRYVGPKDNRQYLYRVSSSLGLASPPALGRLDITWRTAMGEPGRLQTNQLPWKPAAAGTVVVAATHFPGDVKLGQPFAAELAVRNCGDAPLSLRLCEDVLAPGGLRLCGQSEHELPAIAPGEVQNVPLELIATSLGIVPLVGLRLHDTATNAVHPVGEGLSVFVVGAGV